MVKYLLVEDERFAYEELKRMMQRLRPSWQLAGWAESVEQAVLLLRQGSLDLMIVDIRLSDGLSFEIFEQCPVDLPVIFTTAYDEYAIKAFKVNSIDYLLKPIEESDLEAALYNPQIQISAESETKRSIFREKDKTKRSKKESAQHSKSRNKSFVMTSVSAL